MRERGTYRRPSEIHSSSLEIGEVRNPELESLCVQVYNTAISLIREDKMMTLKVPVEKYPRKDRRNDWPLLHDLTHLFIMHRERRQHYFLFIPVLISNNSD